MRVLRYGRWTTTFDRFLGVDRVVFVHRTALVTRPTFDHQPAELVMTTTAMKTPSPTVRSSPRFVYPTMVGVYHYRAMRSDEVVEEGTLTCDSSDHPGFVQVSERDPRYFALSNGDAFCPIGLCLCAPPRYPLPQGMAHFLTSEDTATLGTAEYRRWFRALEAAGANFARLWLSIPCFEPETEVAGELDPARFARLDRIIELARQHGIRLKLCLEHFAPLSPARPFQVLRHPEDGRLGLHGRVVHRANLARPVAAQGGAYIARYGDDPTVMAWELWNEIDCCATSSWEIPALLDAQDACAPSRLWRPSSW